VNAPVTVSRLAWKVPVPWELFAGFSLFPASVAVNVTTFDFGGVVTSLPESLPHAASAPTRAAIAKAGIRLCIEMRSSDGLKADGPPGVVDRASD
jgi:hypothetical protein